MAQVKAIFDRCKHERVVDIAVDEDVQIPALVRGLGRCPECMEEPNVIAVGGIAPQPGGKEVVLDSILMMPI